MKAVVGEEALSLEDHLDLKFTEKCETKFVAQDPYEARTIFESLDIAWSLFLTFPKKELETSTTPWHLCTTAARCTASGSR